MELSEALGVLVSMELEYWHFRTSCGLFIALPGIVIFSTLNDKFLPRLVFVVAKVVIGIFLASICVRFILIYCGHTTCTSATHDVVCLRFVCFAPRLLMYDCTMMD